jgi:hypothetical protein
MRQQWDDLAEQLDARDEAGAPLAARGSPGQVVQQLQHTEVGTRISQQRHGYGSAPEAADVVRSPRSIPAASPQGPTASPPRATPRVPFGRLIATLVPGASYRRNAPSDSKGLGDTTQILQKWSTLLRAYRENDVNAMSMPGNHHDAEDVAKMQEEEQRAVGESTLSKAPPPMRSKAHGKNRQTRGTCATRDSQGHSRASRSSYGDDGDEVADSINELWQRVLQLGEPLGHVASALARKGDPAWRQVTAAVQQVADAAQAAAGPGGVEAAQQVARQATEAAQQVAQQATEAAQQASVAAQRFLSGEFSKAPPGVGDPSR